MLRIELIPFGQFFSRFENSPILAIYILGYCVRTLYSPGSLIMQLYSSDLRMACERGLSEGACPISDQTRFVVFRRQ
jgi:hypothetical protein